MQILIDNQYRVLNALTEAENLARLALPAPPDFGLANSVTVPLGPRPTRALFLMSRGDLDTFDGEAYHTATLIEHDERGIERARRELKQLIFVNARCLTPGKAGDEDAVYLAEFADARWLCHNHAFSVPINKQYNVRAPAWGTSGSTLYYDSSTNSGTAWTWATMIADVWNLMSTQLGSAPSLPFTPDGTPEGWKFPGMSAWVALNQLLYRIGCAITVDLTASSSQFSIVRVGATDTTQDALEAALVLAQAGARIHDEEFIESNVGGFPYGYRVFFQRVQEHYGTEQTTQQTSAQFSTAQVYSVDVNGSYYSDTDSNILTPIWDDLPAIYDASGAITNAAACTTRAAERAADAERMMDTGGAMMHRTFVGLRAFKPGSKLKGVCWRQDLQGIRDPEHPGGWVTEIVRHPFRFLGGRNEQGRWIEEDPGSTALQPPDLAPSYPNYPHLLQVIKLASGTPTSGRYDAYVQVYDPTALTDSNGEQVWAVDLSGATSLAADEKYLARLQGYYTAGTRPIYRFMSKAGTVSGPVTFTSTVTFSSAATTTFNNTPVFNNSLTITPSATTPTSPSNGTIYKDASGRFWEYFNAWLTALEVPGYPNITMTHWWPLDEYSGTRRDTGTVELPLSDTSTNVVGEDYDNGVVATFPLDSTMLLSQTDTSLTTMITDSFAITAQVGISASTSVAATPIVSAPSGGGYGLYFDNATNKWNFWCTLTSGLYKAVWGTATAPGSGEHLVVGWWDKANNLIAISVDNGTPVTVATSGTPSFASPSFWVGTVSDDLMDVQVRNVGWTSTLPGTTGIAALYRIAQGGYNPIATTGFATPLPTTSGGTGLNSIKSGSLVVGNATGNATQLSGSSGQLVVYSGTSAAYVTLSGDATISAAGVLTIADAAITGAKLGAGAFIAIEVFGK